jgi:predicted ATPase with chaperone activity
MTETAIRAPNSINEVGVRRNVLEDLAIKILYLTGEMSLLELTHQMGLGLRIIDELFERLRKEQLCLVTGMDSGIHRITTTSAGKSRALELLAHNQYAGPAPVSLQDYVSRVHAQSILNIEISPESVGNAFKDLVLEAEILNQLGTAAVSGRALFLYGPTGTGKSVIAERLSRLFDHDQIWVPHALEVDGQIIALFDPAVHEEVKQPRTHDHDGRWVRCNRPHVLVGGELTSEMLDLQFSSSTRFYAAPAQMKANNGSLVIDDFGRQRVSPEELLNRWVVPLERRIDFLSLEGGRKIEVPFDLFVIFATNLDPASMVDEALLRRVQTKIKVGFVTTEQFHEISRRVCLQLGLSYDKEVIDRLIRLISDYYKEPLRACHPRDTLNQIVWAAQYERKQAILDADTVTRACRNYFLKA